MKNLQDSKFIKSFSDVLRVWLKANRTRVILLVMLFILGISFFAGGKLFSDSSGKNPKESTDPHTNIANVTEEGTTESNGSSEKEFDTKVPDTEIHSEKQSSLERIEESSVDEPSGEESLDLEASEHESSSEEFSLQESSEKESESEIPSFPESSPEEKKPEEMPVTESIREELTSEQSHSEEPSSEQSTTEPPVTEPPKTEPEPNLENQDGTILCTITVSCIRVYDDPDLVPAEKWQVIPEDGMILPPTEIRVKEGSTVYQVLREVCKQNGILLDASVFSAYVRGIGNLYEFDLGRQSGWMYSVNGKYPSVGCGSYHVEEGDTIEWNYTCHRGDLQPEGEEDNGSNLK